MWVLVPRAFSLGRAPHSSDGRLLQMNLKIPSISTNCAGHPQTHTHTK